MAKNNPSSRNFKFVLYPEDFIHVQALELIAEKFDCWCYCLHDKDLDDKGNLKKPHWHVVLMLDSIKCKDQLCASIQLPSHYCDVITNSRIPVLRYLVHQDHPSKFQYSPDDVKGSPSGISKFQSAYSVSDQSTEHDCAVLIMQYIDNDIYGLTLSGLTRWCIDNDLYSAFRRGFALFHSLLKEHNEYLVQNGSVKRKNIKEYLL